MKYTNFESIKEDIKRNKFLLNEKDNELLLLYLTSKQAGTYGSIDYGAGGNGCSESTLRKDSILIKQSLKQIGKSFQDLTRDDLIDYRNKLKLNEIKATKYKKSNNNKIIKYEKEYTYRSKRSYIQTLRQFWTFYQEYMYQTQKKEIPNIFERISLKKPKETEHNIDYLNSEEIKKFLAMLHDNDNLRLIVALGIDQAPRPIELVNLKRKHFIYEDNKLYCKLPSIKTCSGRKHTNEVLFERAFIERMISKLGPDDFLFDYVDLNKPFPNSAGCYNWNKTKQVKFCYIIRYYTNKIIKKRLTPYMLRKSSIMYWLKITNNDLLWVQKRAGHVEGSEQIRSYIALKNIETPENVLKNLKNDKYENVNESMMAYEEEINTNKLKMEHMQTEIRKMQEQFMNMVSQIPMLNAVNHRELIKQTIKAVKKEKT